MKYLILVYVLGFTIMHCFGFAVGVQFLAVGMLTWGLTTDYWTSQNEKQSL